MGKLIKGLIFSVVLLACLVSTGLPAERSFTTPLRTKEPPAPAVQEPADDPLGRSTPQGTVLGFMRAMGREDDERAVEYLDTKQPPKRAQQLARELQYVLDTGLSGSLANLSRDPQGDLGDGLPSNRERVGVVKTASGAFDILLERVQQDNDPPVWLFSSDTLKHLPEIYGQLKTPLIERYLPSGLTQNRILRVPLWRWIALFVVLPLLLLLVWFMSRALTPLLRPLIRRLARHEDEGAVKRIMKPFRLLVVAFALYVYAPLEQSALSQLFFIHVAETLATVSLTWLCLPLIDILLKRTDRTSRTASGRIAITRLVAQLGKGLIIVTGVAVILYYAGINLTAVLTGLGVGGIAIALAAQKTLENLFGGIMIASDQPIRVGDFFSAGAHSGTVEHIGLRSTRIKTLSRTIVFVPNGQLSIMSLENFTMRDKICFHHTFGLRRETPTNQLRYAMAELRTMLTHHPEVESTTVYVRLTALRDSSFGVEVFAYVLTTVWETFLEIQEDLLLHIIETVEASGTAFAFPSQTSYNATDAGLDAAKGQAIMKTARRWGERGELPFPDYTTKDSSDADSETNQGSSKEAIQVRTGSDQTTE